MSNKRDIQEMLVTFGFHPNYIQRAFKVYEKNYGHSYNVEVITEIIVRLQKKDNYKQRKKLSIEVSAFTKGINKLKWKWTDYGTERSNSFYACIAKEIFGKNSQKTQLQIRHDIYQYIKQSAENMQYFEKMYVKYDNDVFSKRMDEKKNNNIDADNVDIMIVSELYNVRIIVFKYDDKTQKICSTFKCYASCIDIPIILLSKIEGKTSNKWGIIHDIDDIAYLAAKNVKLSDYLGISIQQESMEIIVRSFCNYWLNMQFKYSQYIPNDICKLMIQFMPKFNVRPIGLPQTRNNYLNWNEQMKNKRNEIISYIEN